MKKVELLAPAGGYETMVGAFNAGADAVYLGGSKFGARAYADNFDTEQVLDAIVYAHLHGKKIYMTVNTLVKEKEYGELYDFMLPFAEKDLDGVIIQDLGVMKLIRDEFPQIELHASTQQTVTGIYGARLLKELGCSRVVPARELSVYEMQQIREQADIEVEAFIHGAMCYCYSGMCLFSSMVGTRSGNRGRCAQPCRLPYSSNYSSSAKEQYPLSLKDMCTVDIIPELINAGIDSFKIEGRMKKPEYAAGVTSVYRKYIDLYYKEPDKKHVISKEDMEILKSLYLRTEISQGYYYKHNGKEMVTLDSPAYNGASDKVLSEVRSKYLSGKLKLKCSIDCNLKLGEEACVCMEIKGYGRNIKVQTKGNPVVAASKRPMDEESIKKQLLKLGNTPFEADNVNVVIDDNNEGTGIFIAVSELNELRRTLCDKAVDELILPNNVTKKRFHDEKDDIEPLVKPSGEVHVLVNTLSQLENIMAGEKRGVLIDRIYIDSDLILGAKNTDIFQDIDSDKYIAFPYITREENHDGSKDVVELIEISRNDGFSGVLVRNLEQLGIVHEQNYDGKVILDYGVYIWNMQAVNMIKNICSEISIPLELTIHEACDVAKKVRKELGIPVSLNVYGYTPMMISAGCVKKTMDKCSGQQYKVHSERLSINDRMGNNLAITTNCRNCYNVIWNAHPTSLHKKMDKIESLEMFDYYRVDFTIEEGPVAAGILKYYVGKCKDSSFDDFFASSNYTTGHFKRGAE